MTEKLNSDSFLSTRNFYDDANFPYGFSRSGDFSIAEADTLYSQGYIMTQLHKGELSPTSPEHSRFLDVVNGAVEAKSFEEKTYLKYLDLLKNKNKYISALSKVKPKTSVNEEQALND